MTVYDEFRGAAHRPGAEGWRGGEAQVYVRINSDGLRDREHTRAKPPGAYRIVVLGDSCAEAVQVPLEKTFWAILEQKLRHSGKLATQEVEVINFGVSGYGTAQELITLRRHAWNYQPDLVLLAIMTGNDIRNNSRALDGTAFRPYFVFEQGKLVLDDSFRSSFSFRLRHSWIANAWYKLVAHSRVFQLINEAKGRWASQRQQTMEQNAGLGGGSDGGNWSEPGLDDLIYKPPQSGVSRKASSCSCRRRSRRKGLASWWSH